MELISHILNTKSHFTPELLICAPRGLTSINLACTDRLLEWEGLALFGQYWNILYLFIYFSSWAEGLLVLGYCPSSFVTLRVRHIAPAFQELTKQTIISTVCSQDIRLKDLWRNNLPPFHFLEWTFTVS